MVLQRSKPRTAIVEEQHQKLRPPPPLRFSPPRNFQGLASLLPRVGGYAADEFGDRTAAVSRSLPRP